MPAAVIWLWSWFAHPDSYRRESASALPVFVKQVREQAVLRAQRLGGDGADLLPGLVLGDTSRVSEGLSEAMRQTSLTHLMAVSGANCAIVVGIVWGLVALLGGGVIVRSVCSAFALGGFVYLVGPEPSVIRASVMALIALVAIAVGRPTAGLPLLGLAVSLVLLFAPELSHSIGFALSVSATAGLLVLGPPIQVMLSRFMPGSIAALLALPISASIACQPIIVLLSPYIPTYGVLANILCEPVIPVATVAGLLSLILSPIPLLGEALTFVAWLPATWIAAVARVLASAPFSTIPWSPGALGGMLSFGFSALLIWAILGSRKAFAATAALLVGCLGLGLGFGSGLVAWAKAPREWSLAQCDVGQGDAVLVRNEGKTALIDTGRSAAALTSCLTKLGVSRIDLFVITHFDIDHIGGYEAVLGRVTVAFHGPTDGEADEAILKQLAASGTSLYPVTQGDVGVLGKMGWQVLWPPKKATEPGNPASVVMEWVPNADCVECISVITLGDLPAQQQASLLSQSQIGQIDLVKVSHHGSRDQDPNLYQRLHAPLALIGVGADNDYGHPTKETLDVLEGSGSTVIRSDKCGIALIWREADGSLRVWTER